jgi:hypothetical protein
MTNGMYKTFTACLSVAALLLAANETFARSGGAAAPRAAFASTHPMPHPSFRPSFRHHRGGAIGPFFPAGSGFFYGPSYSEPVPEVSQPVSNDVRYTDTYGVPWDWAHRYPPAVVPSDRPYVSSCPAETVAVPGRGGAEHTVTITRCY